MTSGGRVITSDPRGAGGNHRHHTDLDQGHRGGKGDRLLDTPGSDGAHAQYDHGDDDRVGQRHEQGNIAGAADAYGSGRHHRDRDHQEAHRGGPAVRSVALADIGGLAGGDRQAPAELGEGGGGEPMSTAAASNARGACMPARAAAAPTST